MLSDFTDGLNDFFNAANIVGICEVIAILVSVILDVSHLDHFTWWGLLWYSLYVVSTWFKLEKWTWGAAVTTCSTVLVGVLILSFLQCNMLSAAVSEYGPSGFILGNFFVHYWPCFRLFCFSPPDFWSARRWANEAATERLDKAGGRIPLPARDFTFNVDRQFFRQAAFGFVPLLVYVSVFRTEQVYGCQVSPRGVLAGTLLVFLMNIVVWVWRFKLPLFY